MAAFAALHIHPTGCLVVFVTHTTVYGNDVGLFSDYFHIILFREVLEEKAQLLETIYCCSTYRKYGAKACDSHNLEARVLHEAVFADIQAHAKAAVSNREALVKKIANQMHLRVSSDRAQHKRDLKQCKARIAEIEDLYAKLYEDVSKGLLPEKRFQMLADRYDKEQAELTEKIEQYEREGRAEHDQLDKIQDFIDEVSKYAGITELNYKILHQLIDKILVSRAEKVDGEYVQKIQIFYRFIGPLDAIE